MNTAMIWLKRLVGGAESVSYIENPLNLGVLNWIMTVSGDRYDAYCHRYISIIIHYTIIDHINRQYY